MKNGMWALFVILLLLGAALPAAQAQADGGIQQAMSPEEFHRSGLDKLRPEEVKNLNRWLAGDRAAIVKKASARAARASDLTVSRVVGSFSGLSGATIIRLENGTVWKQANAEDHYGPSPVENPGAAVFHSAFGFKMRIEGVPEFYVNQVRR